MALVELISYVARTRPLVAVGLGLFVRLGEGLDPKVLARLDHDHIGVLVVVQDDMMLGPSLARKPLVVGVEPHAREQGKHDLGVQLHVHLSVPQAVVIKQLTYPITTTIDYKHLLHGRLHPRVEVSEGNHVNEMQGRGRVFFLLLRLVVYDGHRIISTLHTEMVDFRTMADRRKEVVDLPVSERVLLLWQLQRLTVLPQVTPACHPQRRACSLWQAVYDELLWHCVFHTLCVSLLQGCRERYYVMEGRVSVPIFEKRLPLDFIPLQGRSIFSIISY